MAGALGALGGCGDDDHAPGAQADGGGTPSTPDDSGSAGSAEPPDSGGGSGGTGGSGAGPVEDDGGFVPDARAPDAAPPPPSCDDGEMPCGEECIDVIEPRLFDLTNRVFSRSCGLAASCHMGVSAKEDLDLSSEDAVLAAVDRASKQVPSAKLFDTASPEDSYVLRKLRGVDIAAMSSTGTATTQMPPPPSTPLCEEKIELIEAWVRAGAPR
jgi:hypothetical protein